mmetsp:Transcript_68523/g.205279  ORF Transcript_68523/g.205279 Transcript_68523/m.205279 type:complete len:209 (-) Transcript_68523:584-1210(-)
MEVKSPRAVAAAKAGHPESGVKVNARRTICAAPDLLKRRPAHSLCRKSVKVAISRGPSPSGTLMRKIVPCGNLAVLFSTMLRSRTSWPTFKSNAPHSKLLLECTMRLFSTLTIPPSRDTAPPWACAWELTTRLLFLTVTLPPKTRSAPPPKDIAVECTMRLPSNTTLPPVVYSAPPSPVAVDLAMILLLVTITVPASTNIAPPLLAVE